jgi:lipopolysaccharide biosynthesis glycosyltransferase
MNNESNINIVCVANNNYLQHLSVALTSISLNTSSMVNVYLLTSELTAAEDKKLDLTLKKLPNLNIFNLELQDILTDDIIQQFPTSGHITSEAYYRILVPDVLYSMGISKVIYLDCDLIVLKDISNLMNENLENEIIGAVTDIGAGDHYKKMNLNNESDYFNSGVLLINTEEWANNNVTEKLIKCITDNREKITYHDQDALNLFFQGNFKKLDIKWNLQSNYFNEEVVLKDVSIVHFTGEIKPWHFESRHPYKEVYFKFLRRTAWKDFKMKVSSVIILKSWVKRVLPSNLRKYIRQNISRWRLK